MNHIQFIALKNFPDRLLELLVDLLPQTSRYAAILNPKTPSAKYERPDWKERVSRWGSHY